MRTPHPSPPLLAGVVAIALLAFLHTDEIRVRATAALGEGMPRREAELARGFVLGQDERIDPRTVEDFRRAGLSHLLAVSGQNVALLALLAMPFLAALGIPLRMRLVWVLALIAGYVPLAGAGPTILRAGVMGALSILAMLAGRRASRLYALFVAAGVTLAIDPRFGADVGWQLSFAAVLGILLLAAPLRAAIIARLGGPRSGVTGPAATAADGAAMTISATIATAPLIAFHFEAFSTTTLLANLLALPAVAPAMWLGMLAAAAGQVPGAPPEALNALNAPLLAYIAEVAALTGRPSWAYLDVRIGGAGLIVTYAAIAAVAVLAPRVLRSRHLASLRRRRPRRGARSRRLGPGGAVALLLSGLVLAVGLLAAAPRGGDEFPRAAPMGGLRVSFLDVGQGDAILMQPAGAEPILVDAGPPGGGVVEALEQAGVERLGAVIITHDQADHAGGIGGLLAVVGVSEVLHAAIGRRTMELIDESGVSRSRIHAGLVVRAGRLRLEVLWPPPERLMAGADPNHASIVVEARWRGFSMLLCGDTEAEAAPLDPGPVDVLKVAHHGSDDAGLDALLDRIRPGLAVISAGAGNPFGHPTPTTLATLAAHRVQTLRTDRDGTVVVDVGRGSARVASGG